jgi:hypothetical protein
MASLEMQHLAKVRAARMVGPVIFEQQCYCTATKVNGRCPNGCPPRQAYIGPRDAETCGRCGKKALVPNGKAKICTNCGDDTSLE